MGEPIREGSMTGRHRYKAAHYGSGAALILQVQVNHWAQGREDKVGRWVTEWRDATPEDVPKEELA